MRYSDNPNLSLPVITTITGRTEYANYCRHAKGNYYIIGEECLRVNTRWYYCDTSIIIYDSEKKCYVLSNKKMITGVTAITEDGIPVLGNFSSNPFYNVSCTTVLGDYTAKDYRDLQAEGFIEDMSTGRFFDHRAITLRRLNSVLNNSSSGSNYRDKGYNIEDNRDEFAEKKKYFSEFEPRIKAQTKRYARLLGDISWGIETEFSSGGLPEYIQNQLGIVICRDGSTSSGGEAVTVPYQGAKGLHLTKRLGLEGTKRLTTDLSCSLHIHIGNLNLSRDYMISLYRLWEKIQDELYQLFPYYKTNPEGIKSKNYNKKLKPLFKPYNKAGMFSTYDEWQRNAYTQIFHFLSDGRMPCYDCNRKQEKHPINAKWDRANRYYGLNLSNAIFSPRHTVEFRLHHGSLNSQKIVNWLFMCNAICKYAEAHMRNILINDETISLEQVFNYYRDTFPTSNIAVSLSEYLNAYSDSRKADMVKDYKARDYGGKRENNEDSTYSFEYGGIKDLF